MFAEKCEEKAGGKGGSVPGAIALL